MGNICHAGPVLRDDEQPPRSNETPKRAPNFGRDPNLKKEDFIFTNIHEPTCLVKHPGSINGQQFLIDNCSNCDIFLLDNCTSVQIDDCTNCRIVVGPCESSLFVRNCKKCTIVCAVQQFRTRDCEDIDTYLYSSTEPIIELSTKIRFACFPLSYFSLQQQFDKARFSVWNNRWSEIYNFNPDHGSWKPIAHKHDESPLASAVTSTDDGPSTLWSMPPSMMEELGLTVESKQLIIPLTAGVGSRQDTEITLILVFVPPLSQLVHSFVLDMATAGDGGDPRLIQTKQMKFTPAQAKGLFSTSQNAQTRASEAFKSAQESIIVEFQGSRSYERLAEVRAMPKYASDSVFTGSIISSSDDTQAKRMSEQVFVEWKQTV